MIVVVLSKPKKFYFSSWLIRAVTGFGASHASIHMLGKGLFAGERLIFESTSHGIGLVHPSIWEEHNEVVYAYEYTGGVEAGAAGLRAMWTHLGADYDYLGLFRFGWRLLLARMFGAKLEAPDTPNTMFCSELVARWLNEVKAQLGLPPGSLRPDEVSPAGLSAELERSELFRSLPCPLSWSATST